MLLLKSVIPKTSIQVAISVVGSSSVEVYSPILIYSTKDYDAIDLPVFTCSSRDYVRLQGELYTAFKTSSG